MDLTGPATSASMDVRQNPCRRRPLIEGCLPLPVRSRSLGSRAVSTCVDRRSRSRSTRCFGRCQWDIHRLRGTRQAVIQSRLVERLALREANTIGMKKVVSDQYYSIPELRISAQGFLRGEDHALEYFAPDLGTIDLNEEIHLLCAETIDVLARIESSIHATSRLRDTLINRLYVRRDNIAEGRITSGSARWFEPW